MGKLLFKNATIATSTDVLVGDLLTEGDKIVAFGKDISSANTENAKVIDATGKYLLPGGVDVHTHFDLDVGIARASDNFYTGSIAAACGGTTTVIDHMAFGPKGCSLSYPSKIYRELAKDATIDYGLHGVIQHVDETVLADMERLKKEEGITSYKIYMTYDYALSDDDILQVLRRAKELGITICVHAENHAMVTRLRKECVAEGKTTPHYQPLTRPAESEAEAVFRVIMLAKCVGEANIYIVHLSTELGLNAIRLARQDGQKNIFAETCPQYLFLEDSLYDAEDSLKYMIAPPLRKTKDCNALWKGLQQKDIDTIATDHCPFFFATQKQQGKDDFTKTPGGAPGVELRMSLLFSKGFLDGAFTLPDIVRLCCTRPAQIFGVAPQKGDIAVGADADLVLFDPTIQWTVTKSELHENVDYTPYEGIALKGRPILTVSRGEIIVENNNFTGNKGRGKYLFRK